MSRLYLLFDFIPLIIMHLQDPFNVGCCRFKNVNSRWEEHKQDIDLLAKHLCQALPESLTWSQCLATRIANFLALSIAEKLSRTSAVAHSLLRCHRDGETRNEWLNTDCATVCVEGWDVAVLRQILALEAPEVYYRKNKRKLPRDSIILPYCSTRLCFRSYCDRLSLVRPGSVRTVQQRSRKTREYKDDKNTGRRHLNWQGL